MVRCAAMRSAIIWTGILLVTAMAAMPARGQEKPRIFVAPNEVWRSHEDASGRAGVETENRTIEVSRNFAKSCKAVAVNVDLENADYIVELNRRTKYAGITIVRTDIAVYRRNGDLVGGASKSSVGSAVKAACDVIKRDWLSTPPQTARPTARPASLPQ